MKVNKKFYVYIIASGKNGTIYIGVTNSLIRRINQHKQKGDNHFTNKYNVNLLVYYEIHDTALSAISREKQLKNWRRDWKISLIEKDNPSWKDLFDDYVSGS